jgi:hypothetical protein
VWITRSELCMHMWWRAQGACDVQYAVASQLTCLSACLPACGFMVRRMSSCLQCVPHGAWLCVCHLCTSCAKTRRHLIVGVFHARLYGCAASPSLCLLSLSFYHENTTAQSKSHCTLYRAALRQSCMHSACMHACAGSRGVRHLVIAGYTDRSHCART